jgi:hypothetical protein
MPSVIDRARMIVDLPSEVQMAIRLRAVKSNMTTGAVVCLAVQQAFGNDVQEAKAALAEQHGSKPSTKRQRP